jgi:hypothetical protein
MLLLKRLLTAFVLFVLLFATLYLGFCIVGGAVAGGVASVGQTDPTQAAALGRQAGAKFVQDNLAMISLTSLGVAALISGVISFSGILPWCKKSTLPPYL